MFYAILVGSILLLLFVWFNKDEHEEGTYSTHFEFNMDPVYRLRKIPVDSRGERECRRVLEQIFKSSFPKKRPSFLHNKVTGQPLEIDCFNEELMLGCEYNGRQHYEYVPRFHRSRESFHNQQYRDDIKYRACAENNIRLIIVPYTVQIPQIESFIREKLISLGYRVG